MKHFLVSCAIFVAMVATSLGAIALTATYAHAADLIGTGAGDSDLNQTYIDQFDGNWLGENLDYKICTYSGTYAIITAYADVCGSGAQQWYYNFGVTVTSAGIASLAPVNWTNNFFTPPAPQFTEDTPPGPPDIGGATSTVDQMHDNLYYGFIVFFLSMFGMIWLMRKH